MRAPELFSVTMLPARVPGVTVVPMFVPPLAPSVVIDSGCALAADEFSGSDASPARTVPRMVRPAPGVSVNVNAPVDPSAASARTSLPGWVSVTAPATEPVSARATIWPDGSVRLPAVFSVMVLPARVPGVETVPMLRPPLAPSVVMDSCCALRAAEFSGSDASPARTTPAMVRAAPGVSVRENAPVDPNAPSASTSLLG